MIKFNLKSYYFFLEVIKKIKYNEYDNNEAIPIN